MVRISPALAHKYQKILTAESKERPHDPPRILIIQMANMLSELVKMRTVEGLDLVTPTGDTVLERMAKLSARLVRDLSDCAHLIHRYHARPEDGKIDCAFI